MSIWQGAICLTEVSGCQKKTLLDLRDEIVQCERRGQAHDACMARYTCGVTLAAGTNLPLSSILVSQSSPSSSLAGPGLATS